MSKTINQDNLNASLRFFQKRGEMQLEQLRAADPQQAELVEKLRALFHNEDLCLAFFSCADAPAAVQLLADNGIPMAEAEVKLLDTQLRAIAQKLMDNDGTLSEEELEQIAGGVDAKTANAEIKMFTAAGWAFVIGAGLLGLFFGPAVACLAAGATATLVGGTAYLEYGLH